MFMDSISKIASKTIKISVIKTIIFFNIFCIYKNKINENNSINAVKSKDKGLKNNFLFILYCVTFVIIFRKPINNIFTLFFFSLYKYIFIF